MKLFAKIKENRRRKKAMKIAIRELFEEYNPPKTSKKPTMKVVYRVAS
jgi:hypothetical protein